jgi:hypothetical protein
VLNVAVVVARVGTDAVPCGGSVLADRELKNLSELTVKRRLAKEWDCITGDAARVYVNGIQRSCVKWPALDELRAKFEAKHGKQDWTHTTMAWLSARLEDQTM